MALKQADPESDARPSKRDVSDETLRDITGISPDEEEKMEQAASTGALEDQYAQDAHQKDEQEKPEADSEDGDKEEPKELTPEELEAQEDAALRERVGSAWEAAKVADSKEKSLYKGSGEDKPTKGLLDGLGGRRRRRWIAGGSIAMVLVGVLTFGIFSFLNIFKLDSLVNNIDAKAFARLNGNLDGRSTHYMRAYMTLRLADIGDNPDLTKPNDPDNLILRSNKVSTGNPAFDLYRTWRTSKFEEDVFTKHGFKFASIAERRGNKIVLRPAIITYNHTDLTFDPYNGPDKLTAAEIKAIEDGDVNKLNGRLSAFVDREVFETDKQARREIKKRVNDNTRFYQVFQRRHIRKDIQNMTGVREWRFFEKSRNRLDEKKLEIRNKIIAKAIPETTKTGKFMRCLFGISDCKSGSDVGDPENKSDVADTGGTDKNTGDVETGEVDADGKKKTIKYDTKTITAGILKHAGIGLAGVNAVGMIDMLATIDGNITSGKLSDSVEVAKGTQAAGLYQVVKTSRDQNKSGETNGPEVNEFMQVFGNVGNSEGWTKVIQGQGKADELTNNDESREYCSAKHQAEISKPANREAANKEQAFLCGEEQIGGKNGADKLKQVYLHGSGVGSVIHPMAEAYRAAKSGILGPIINGALTIGGFLGDIASTAVQPVLDALGIGQKLNDLFAWASTEAASMMGAGPIMNGNEPAGVYMNWLIQGAAYTAESAARFQGAVVTVAENVPIANQNANQYLADQAAMQSTFSRYMSLDNPNSSLAKATFSFSETVDASKNGLFNTIQSAVKSLGSITKLPFAHAQAADSDLNYRACQFAGIHCFDFPKACTDMDPITARPETSTNIQQILPGKVTTDELTWDLVTDKDAWYKFVYEKIGDQENADDIAQGDGTPAHPGIYNCQLLDNSVRGSMGNLYGYNKDHGLEDGSDTSNSTPPADQDPTDFENININGYAWPVALTKAEASNGYSWPCPSQCHHDGTPAFDLANKTSVGDTTGEHDADSVGRAEFAITAGTIKNLHIYDNIPGCYSFHILSSVDGYDYYYTHARNPVVKTGDRVTAGQKVAEIGERKCTGNGSYPHLHIDRGSPKGAGGGNVCCRDQGMVPLINKLYANLPS